MKFQLYKQRLILNNLLILFFILLFFCAFTIAYPSIGLFFAHKNINKNSLKDYQVNLSEAGTSSATPWSNAFNFKGVWGAQIDPRTGILSIHVKAGSLLSNLGHGPNIDLEVNYSSNASTDADKLGTGWSWNLTHFNPATNGLVTAIGQSFYLYQKNNGQWYPLYHKMHDIHIGGTKANHFIITYANGLRETLDHQGYETMLEQQDGWRVHFIYQPGTHRLQSVSDDEGHNITLLYQKDQINVISKGSEGQQVSVLLNVKKGELHKIVLPLQQHHAGYSMDFNYIGHLLTKTSYPTGLIETFTYNCTEAMKISRTENFLAKSLCVIIRKKVNPGAGQAVMQESYRYSKTNSNEHDYLGFNAQLATTMHAEKDILFDAPINYTYQTQEDNGIIREIRTYNKYHLLIDDQRISDRTGHKLSEIQTFFCRADQLNGCAQSTFEKLPLTYSRPLKVITKLWNDTEDTPAMTTETYRYNHNGRMIAHKDAYGCLSKFVYCPVKGDLDCPAEPDGWNLDALTKSVTVYPANIGSTILTPIVTRNYYRKLPNRKGHGYILVLDHQTKQSGVQKVTTTRRYYQDAKNSLTYGLLKQTRLTDNIQTPSVLHDIIHDFYYKMSMANRSKTTYSATELSAGKQRFSPFVTSSLFTNNVLYKADFTEKNTLLYHYDLWGRVVQTDMDPGTPFAVSTYYQYMVSPQRNQLIITAANGLRSKIIFDGAGRPLIRFREALSDDGKKIANHWIPVSKTTYDNHGRIAEQFSYIISPSGETKILTTTQEYDDSGRSIRVHLPDGETSISQYDDAQRCVVSYQRSADGRSSAISLTYANVLYKPTQQWLLPGNNNTLPPPEQLCYNYRNKAIPANVKISQITYDGFGRIITATDPLGHIVKKEYDALGRLINIIDPKGDKIHNVYDLNGHIIQRWALPASGGNYLLASAEYNTAGELLWRAGEDGLATKFTYTREGQLSTTITPDGHVMSLQYNEIGLPVSKQVDGKIQTQISYDPITLLIKTQTDNTGKTLFSYSDDGLPLYLQHIGIHNYLTYKLQWAYDKNRQTISVTDINANKTQTIYDTLGRVTEVRYHPEHGKTVLLSTLNYDSFSRISAVHYGSGMQRKINYDSFGHPKNVSDKLNGGLLSSWSFVYDANNNITTQVYQAENNQQAIFHYEYDSLNNLVSMTCGGSFGLPLCPRDTAFSETGLQEAPVITRQDYYFTPLNRIAQIHESLQSSIQIHSLKKITSYHYTDSSVPLQLQSTSTLWNNQSAVVHHFNYDVMGNMTTDGEGNHISYNAFNQVTQVIQPNGEQSHYGYDGNKREIYEKNRLGVHYLFYRGQHLINERINTPNEKPHTIGYQGIANTIDGLIHQYNESNYKGDVISVLKQNSANSQYQLSQRNIYSPYGMRWHVKKNLLPVYQRTFFGFDGERTDPATGWQFLGAGHRTYNPKQRYFVSEDPAGGGYGFGSNNPIMNSDPSGNMPKWLGSAFRWANYISSFGLDALHAKWAHIAGAVITSALTVATLGGSAYSCGSTLLTSAVTAGATLAGSVPVVAAAIPANKGLNIAASVVGLTAMAAMAATAAADIGLYLFTPQTMSLLEKIPLEALPLNMLKGGGGTAGKIALFDVAALIKSELPDYIYTFFGKPYLKVDDFNGFSKVWDCLFSCNSTIIQCDTLSVLAFAKMIKRPLSIEDLENFLRAKIRVKKALMDDYTPTEGDKISTNYLAHFIGIITKLYNKRPFIEKFGDNQVTSFKDLPLDSGEVGLVIAPNHTQIIGKFSNDIFIAYGYDFYNNVFFDVDTVDVIERDFFYSISNPSRRYIMFFLKFTLW